MKSIIGVISIVLLVTRVESIPQHDNAKYRGAQVFRISPTTPQEVEYLRELHSAHHYDFWTEKIIQGHPIDVMVPQTKIFAFKKKIVDMNMKFEIIISDLYQTITKNRARNDEALSRSRNSGKTMSWTAYHDYNDIMAWADDLAAKYSSLVSVEDAGLSYEGRSMKFIKVSTGGSGKPAIFADAGIHAREWISPATVTYIINELVVNSTLYMDILNEIDLYFMPVINPDGYQYTFDSDRLWRKTRSINSSNRCVGADPNRNWDFHWMEQGASPYSCTETYAGPEPFSEVEMQIVRDQLLNYGENIKVYLSFHSYSQVWMYPWGYAAELPEDWKNLDHLATRAVNALTAVHGTRFDVGSTAILLYPAAGGSDDYAKGVVGIDYSYTVELRDTGRDGFELPEEQIIPSGEETLAAFKEVMEFVQETFVPK